jgi:hypothetical protein
VKANLAGTEIDLATNESVWPALGYGEALDVAIEELSSVPGIVET